MGGTSWKCFVERALGSDEDASSAAREVFERRCSLRSDRATDKIWVPASDVYPSVRANEVFRSRPLIVHHAGRENQKGCR